MSYVNIRFNVSFGTQFDVPSIILSDVTTTFVATIKIVL